MATHTGLEGVLKIGANAIAEVKSFIINQVGDTVEDTVKGDTWRTFKPTLNSWTGETTVQFDEADTNGQEACTIGAEVTGNFYPGGETAGNKLLSGSAIITARDIESPEDGMVMMNLTLQGNGALAESAVT